jgi:selenocysteine-specific elongation factor
MLAGVGPVPAVMIVVAADEGWMPQSAEHLAALDALGVRHGLLVVSRADLTDPGAATDEAMAHISRTSLGPSIGAVPPVAVSGATGAGIDDLRKALSALVAGLPAPDAPADVRLWVDRSFTVGGAGTVVTGTLPAGTLHTGDELVLASTGARVRVRGLQTLGRRVDAATAVARVAVNLRGVDRRTIARGDALLSPDAWLRTKIVDATLHAALPTSPATALATSPATGQEDVPDLPAHVVLHVGSAAVPARLRPLGPSVVRLTLASGLPLRVGDRVLLRDPGQHRVVGGATVLDVRPPVLTRRGAATARAGELAGLAAEDATAQHLRHRGFVHGTELRAMGLRAPGRPLVDDWHVSPDAWRAARDRLPAVLDAWRRDNPLDEGIPGDVLRRRVGLPDQALVAPLIAEAGLVVRDGRVHRAGAHAALPPRLEAAVAAVTAELADAPFAAPDAERLRELGLGPRELAAAARAGRLLKIAEGVVLLPDAGERAVQALKALRQPFTLSEARQALGTTRRVAVPLLEFLDRQRVTLRLPDSTRRLR